MAYFNKVILIGNLTADPELKSTQNTGIPVCRFSIAVNRRATKDQTNPQTDFFQIVVWRQAAQFVSNYFKKGSSILVCGQVQNNKWTDKDGKTHERYEILADEVTFGGNKSANGSNSDEIAVNNASYVQSGDDNGYTEASNDSDLPF